MKDEIELYLPKDHNVAQEIIIPPGVHPGKRYLKKRTLNIRLSLSYSRLAKLKQQKGKRHAKPNT